MIYNLVFKEDALKEWRKLDSTLKKQFKKKLEERRVTPRVPSARLSQMKNCYKIKLKGSGYRLVYEVRDKTLIIAVIAIGKRERSQVYRLVQSRRRRRRRVEGRSPGTNWKHLLCEL